MEQGRARVGCVRFALVAGLAIGCATGGAAPGGTSSGGTGASGTGSGGTPAAGTGTAGVAAAGAGASGTGAAGTAVAGTNAAGTGTAGAAAGVGAAGAGTAGMGVAGTSAVGCNPTDCAGPGLMCCGDRCANTQNDIKNCGACGTVCPGANPYCDMGACGTAPCLPGATTCGGGMFCCALRCCNAGDLCCTIPGPVTTLATCVKPNDAGTCPNGCTTCKCTSPDTPIATPDGERAIASLREGDLVYSVDGSAVLAVPIAAVFRNPVDRHEVVRVTLANGTRLEISAGHPLADGRAFGDLRAGDEIDGVRVLAAETVPYAHPFTYDILPASRSGAYYAGGVLVRSTLNP